MVDSVAIGNPERHVRKASHRGSKQQKRSPDEITLLLLVRATYIYFCSSRTSRSWWITQSTQHHRRGCNNSLLSLMEWSYFNMFELCWTWSDFKRGKVFSSSMCHPRSNSETTVQTTVTKGCKRIAHTGKAKGGDSVNGIERPKILPDRFSKVKLPTTEQLRSC